MLHRLVHEVIEAEFPDTLQRSRIHGSRRAVPYAMAIASGGLRRASERSCRAFLAIRAGRSRRRVSRHISEISERWSRRRRRLIYKREYTKSQRHRRSAVRRTDLGVAGVGDHEPARYVARRVARGEPAPLVRKRIAI